MTTETKVMGVPESSCSSRHEIEGGVIIGGVIIRHLVRQPGACSVPLRRQLDQVSTRHEIDQYRSGRAEHDRFACVA